MQSSLNKGQSAAAASFGSHKTLPKLFPVTRLPGRQVVFFRDPKTNTETERKLLFEEVCSSDFLGFAFHGRSYQDQLDASIAKTKELAGVKVELITVPGFLPESTQQVVWVTHNFQFLGGSLGCAEGEKITRAFEYALENNLPVCVVSRSGGARMQEGTSSLMQMAKVSVAVRKLHKAGLPFVSVLEDPTYGGVSASYAMQADVRIGMSDARIGFAGPQVILNTSFEQNQQKYDSNCPPDFQSASYLYEHGQLDMVLDRKEIEAEGVSVNDRLEALVGQISSKLILGGEKKFDPTSLKSFKEFPVTAEDKSQKFDYEAARMMDRPQASDLINHVFDSYIELSGDGQLGRDSCIRGGLATFMGRSCMVIGTHKGHTPGAMQNANFSMGSPHGYRTAIRLMEMAERFNMPVVTLIDTVGAWPTFECERDGQAEAIANALTTMAGLKVPIVSLLVGEGGSGGALGVGMGNRVGMLSGGYFGVISPEGAASILGVYKNEEEKKEKFKADCMELANAQCIYADKLQEIGVVDEIIWEKSPADGVKENYQAFPVLKSRVQGFILRTLEKLTPLSPADLVEDRYNKFRSLGTYSLLNEGERAALVEAKVALPKKAKKGDRPSTTPSMLVQHIANESVNGTYSRFRGLAPSSCPTVAPEQPPAEPRKMPAGWTNAKKVLDEAGPEAMVQWVKAQKKVLLTDTTMRDAHQSHLATRVRGEDLIKSAKVANEVFKDLFSLEVWGGATFDVCMRFTDECPWERLREIRAAAPDVCTQMLLRGANAVGYTSYPDNVVEEFVMLAAKNGMDIFRIFDCFNDVESMQVSINAVRKANKVANVAICYTGDVLNSKIYNLDYYKDVADRCVKAGAHMLSLKDMAGLLRPQEAGPLMAAIREVTDLPIHYHTHATSAGAIATCMEMARLGCDIIDSCTASMADGTSQPSMNAFVAMLEGTERDPGINYMDMEPYDMYWARVRDMYAPFESGMKSGSARVYQHQIPGGQYSNLYMQCRSMGLWDRWEEVLDAYRDANDLFGNIVKVTPSSKCVGDMALYLVTRNMKASDVLKPEIAAKIDFPESVVDLLKGNLGFPHRGFPIEVERAVLKNQKPRTVRPGIDLPAVDFKKHIAELSEKLGVPITPEDSMSSLMYPKVFADLVQRRKTKGKLLKHLPTPVYLYGMTPKEKFTMQVPAAYAKKEALIDVAEGVADDALVDVTVEMQRIEGLARGTRKVWFTVNGKQQIAEVKDATGKFVFEGPMADAKKAGQMGSPMPGHVEKLLVKKGDTVKAGDTLCTVSAMKMEVKVTAPFNGKVTNVPVSLGTRVIDNALLVTLEEA